MIEPIIHGLSNEQYHRGKEERQYLSSSQLKWYLKSPRHAKYMFDALTYGDAQAAQNNKAVADIIEGKSDALRFGSLFHDLMASYAEHSDDEFAAIRQWELGLAIFEPPVNKSTNKPYGVTSNPYKEAYAAFLQASEGKTISTQEETDLAIDMVRSLTLGCDATSEQVRKLLKWGKPEVSFFYETEDGIKLKVRPDLLTRKKIIDWKTTTSDDLTEENINRIILKYGYHISAAMYQWVIWKITGVWRDFYLVIVSKAPPHDCVMVNMCAVLKDIYDRYHYGYGYCIGEDNIVMPGCGALVFRKLLDLHKQCVKNNKWPGVEINIPEDRGARVLEIQPPYWYESKIMEL